MSAESVDEVVGLLERWGDDPYDEELAQLDHALQTAALARAAGSRDSLIAAALLHDVGHLLDLRNDCTSTDDDRRHEDTGSAWLRPLFPVTVTAPIALHVRAKRFLCAIEPSYVEGLSTGSIRSLARQGGPMSHDEVESFRTLTGADDAVALRRWDDAGKVMHLDVGELADYLDLLRRVTTAAPRSS